MFKLSLKFSKTHLVAAALAAVTVAGYAQAGVYLRCKSVQSSGTVNGGDFFMNDYSVAIAGTLFGECSDLNGRPYSMVLDGISPGLLWGQSYFTLACPTVSKTRLNRKRHMNFGAVRATAAAGIGGTVGVMASHTGGACFLAGFELGVGASMNIGHMGLHTGSVNQNGLRSIWLDHTAKKQKRGGKHRR